MQIQSGFKEFTPAFKCSTSIQACPRQQNLQNIIQQLQVVQHTRLHLTYIAVMLF